MYIDNVGPTLNYHKWGYHENNRVTMIAMIWSGILLCKTQMHKFAWIKW